MRCQRLYALIVFIALLGCNNKTEQAPPVQPPVQAKQNLPKIVAFGNSLTAGLGLPAEETYPAQLQKLINADGYHYEVVNAGVSGDTSSGGLRRLDWSMEPSVKIVILELGANDMLRGIPMDLTKRNLAAMIEKIRARNAEVVLAGIEALTSTGPEYRKQVHQAFLDLSKQYPVTFIPFFFEGITEKDIQADGTHPNADGAAIIAKTVYAAIKPLL